MTKIFRIMKKTFFAPAVMTAVALVCSCTDKQQECTECDKQADVQIAFEGGSETLSRSGRVDFVGGYATGEGYYLESQKPEVQVFPNTGYKVSYFYGGPTSKGTDDHTYDYATTGATLFKPNLGEGDHLFHVGFEKKMATLTLNAATGGTVSGGGSIQCDVDNTITATANSGYSFTGWSVSSGSPTIASPAAATTNIVITGNCTVLANFKKNAASSTTGSINFYVQQQKDGSYSAVSCNFTLAEPLDRDVTITIKGTIMSSHNSFNINRSQTITAGGTSVGFDLDKGSDINIPNGKWSGYIYWANLKATANPAIVTTSTCKYEVDLPGNIDIQ